MAKITKREKLAIAQHELEILAKKEQESKWAKKQKVEKLLCEDLETNILIKAIRPIEDFKLKTRSSNRDKQRLELIKHLFVKYPVAKILEQAWAFEKIATSRWRTTYADQITLTEYISWYICMATGGSLHKEYLKDFMTKKETHAFIGCTKSLDINQAIYYATALCAGANEGIAFRIAKSKLGLKNKSDVFWRDCARFFAKNVPDSIEQTDDIIDFLENKKLENENFNIFGQGYTIKTLLKRVKDWHYELRRLKELSNYFWEGFPLNNGVYIKKDEQGKNVTWTMTQILTGKDLAKEGNVMHHCVYSYKQHCINGRTSIWSLKRTGTFGEMKGVATVEVNNSGRVIQARGFANRSLKSNESNIISIWAKENDISFL